MTDHVVEMDERAVAVNHTAGHYAYLLMSWMLVLDMLLRGVRPSWTSWNGMPIDIVLVLAGGGLTHLAYALRHRTVGRRRTIALASSIAVAAVLAAVLVLAWSRLR